MGSTGFNGSVQTLRFCIAVIHLSLRHHNQIDTIPILCICDCVQQVRRMMWVLPINEMCTEKGEFNILYPDLCHFPLKFFNMYRMSVPKFDALLKKVAPKLQKKWTIMWEPLSAEQKLIITLR